MPNRIKKSLAAALTASMGLSMASSFFAVPVAAEETTEAPALIPKPDSYTAKEGTFVLGEDAKIIIQGKDDADTLKLNNFAMVLAGHLRASTGYELPIEESDDTAGNIVLTTKDGQESLEEEGYTLSSDATSVIIRGYTPAGVWNGAQTLRQMFPSDIESPEVVEGMTWSVPAADITDTPEYGYRGMHLDVARHFFNKDEVMRQIDLISQFKINKLHLHLSDDQGWRLEIKGEMYGESFDKLRTIGASTSCSDHGYRPGMYTQEDFVEMVNYAASRNVEIIPEFDMPAHAWAALVSLNFLNSTEDGKPVASGYDNTKPYEGWDVGWASLETRNEKTYEFVEEVVKQVAAISPSEYIHLGGDEAHSTAAADYSYFVNRTNEIGKKYGKKVIQWQNFDNVVEDKENGICQFWSTGNAKMKSGVKYVATPADHAYMDMKYDSDCEWGLTWATMNPVDDSYNWEPTNYGTKDQIIGVECALWSETLGTLDAVDYMTFPRVAGHAEVGWTAAGTRSWDEYKNRINKFDKRFEHQGINYKRDELIWPAPHVPVDMDFSFDEGTGTELTDANGKTATLVGNVEYVDGIKGKAVSFDGGGYIDFSNKPYDGDWSASMWVKRGESTATNTALLSCSIGEIKLEQWKNTHQVGLTKFGDDDWTFDYTAPIGEWVHLAFVRNGSKTDLYVNGELNSSIAQTIPAPVSRLGANAKSGLEDSGNLHGAVDELKVYERALSAEEIKALATIDEEPDPALDGIRSLLKSAMDYALVIRNSDSFAKLNPIVQNLINTRYAEAEAAYNNSAATFDELAEAWSNLSDAVHYANYYADKTDLKAAIDQYKDTDTTRFTEESAAAFNAALENAQAVYADETALQERIDAALQQLIGAFNGLTEKPAVDTDKSLLALLLDTAADINDKANLYKQDEAWSAWQALVTEGQAVYDNQAAAQSEVDDVVVRMNAALCALRMIPDEDILKTLNEFLAAAAAIDTAAYTNEELSIINNAVELANTVIANGTSDQKTVSDALYAAADASRLIGAKTASNQVSNEPGQNPVSKSSSVSTSAATDAGFWMVAAAACAAALLASRKRD